jgi:RimJ/RimL family protein N-acetyltransferase
VARQLRDRFPSPYTAADAERWLSAVGSRAPATSFAIAVGEEAVGGVGLEVGEDVHRLSAEVGYWLGEDFWGRGLATAALASVTRYALDELGLLRVFAMPFADNAASIRVLEKAGYAREGLLRSAAVKEGLVRDMLLYAITRAP